MRLQPWNVGLLPRGATVSFFLTSVEHGQGFT